MRQLSGHRYSERSQLHRQRDWHHRHRQGSTHHHLVIARSRRIRHSAQRDPTRCHCEHPRSFCLHAASGAVLAAGSQNITATFTPADATDYTSAPANVSLTVNKALPTIAWARTRSHRLRHSPEHRATRCHREHAWNLRICTHHRVCLSGRHSDADCNLHADRHSGLHHRTCKRESDREQGYRYGCLQALKSEPNI